MTHRKGFYFLAVLALTFAATSAIATGQVREFQETTDFNPGDRLSIKTFKGSIHVTSWAQNGLEVLATIEAPRDVDSEYAEQVVEATRIEVRRSGKGVVIRADYDDVPSNRGWWGGSSKTLPYVHFEIRAPRSLQLQIDDHKSEIELFGLEGNIDVETHKGTIDGQDLAGELRIETHKGVVNLASIRGGFDLETHKGEISVQADQLDSRSRLVTHKGRIVLSVPEAQGANIRADLSKRADFRSDFDMERNYRSKYRFDADMNGGGPEIFVSTHKGDIRIRRN